MGRYISSILPLLVLPIALVVKRAFDDGVLAGAAIVLGALSLAVSASFARDLVPSWQPELLWDRVLYCDPVQYLPNFVSEGFLGSGPAHFPKLLAELLALSAIVYFLRDRVASRAEHPRFTAGRRRGSARSSRGHRGSRGSSRAVSRKCRRRRGSRASARPGSSSPAVKFSVEGEHGFEGDGVWVPGSGSTRFTLLTREATPSLSLSFSNGPEENVVEVRERGSANGILDLPAEGPHERTVLLRKPYRFVGPRGERFLYVFDDPLARELRSDRRKTADRRRLGTYVRVR